MGLRILSGAPPPSVGWPLPLPPVGCHQTRNCPRVPLTYRAASTAHLVTILSTLVHNIDIYHVGTCVWLSISLSVEFGVLVILLQQVEKAPRPPARLQPQHLLLVSQMSFPLYRRHAAPPAHHARYSVH